MVKALDVWTMLYCSFSLSPIGNEATVYQITDCRYDNERTPAGVYSPVYNSDACLAMASINEVSLPGDRIRCMFSHPSSACHPNIRLASIMGILLQNERPDV